MNNVKLMNALKKRLAVDGTVDLEDVDLLVWTATSLNANPMELETTRTIRLYRDGFDPQKIPAIKGLRQMGLDLTGQTWGLKETKEMCDKAEEGLVVVIEDVALELATSAVEKFNALGTGYYVQC